MRLLFERCSRFVSAFWIKRRKNDIIGWFTTHSTESSFAPKSAEEKVDVHFRYPEDGNFHFSFKYHDIDAGLKRVESYYFDRMRVKIFEEGQVQISERLRAESEPTQASLFVPEHPLTPLQEYATTGEMFFFPTTGFNALPDQTPSIFNSVETTPRPDDLVISLRPSEAFNVSFSACLLGRDANTSLWPLEAKQQRFQTQEDTAYPIIQLWASLKPYT